MLMRRTRNNRKCWVKIEVPVVVDVFPGMRYLPFQSRHDAGHRAH